VSDVDDAWGRLGGAFDLAGWAQAVELDEDARTLVEGHRFPLCQPEPLRELFLGAGLGVRG
jgi:hypothetical protein